MAKQDWNQEKISSDLRGLARRVKKIEFLQKEDKRSGRTVIKLLPRRISRIWKSFSWKRLQTPWGKNSDFSQSKRENEDQSSLKKNRERRKRRGLEKSTLS